MEQLLHLSSLIIEQTQNEPRVYNNRYFPGANIKRPFRENLRKIPDTSRYKINSKLSIDPTSTGVGSVYQRASLCEQIK